MKKLQWVSGAILLVIATTTSVAHAAQYVAADNHPASKICVSAAVDKPIQLTIQLRDAFVSKTYAANQISCNGINLTTFAYQAGNQSNHKMLSRYRRGYVEINDLAQLPPADSQVIYISGQLAEASGSSPL